MPARLRRYGLSLFAVLGLILGHLPVLAGEPVRERLPNGLQVVVQRLDRAPVVSVQIWVKAGSRLEEPVERGLTHQIEHMIFKGTPSRGLGQVAGQIEEAGGRINAYTSFDHTVYHATLPAERWEMGLEVLADAVKNSLFDADELAKEKEVVLEEWRRGQDSPHRLLFETVLGTAFQLSPYHYPVIGSDATIRGFTRQMILDYTARWYTADRVTLVVVGQVEPASVLAKAGQVLGDFRPANQRLYRPPQEPPQAEFRFKALNGRVKQAYLALAFRAFGLSDPRTPAADLLAELLGGGQASRLVERLWGGRGLVSSISANSFTPLDEGLWWVTAACDPAKVEEAAGAIWQELARTTAEPFGAEELARSKLAFKAAFIRDKETMDGQASKLGYFEVLAGGLTQEAEYLKAVESLSAEELRRRAERLFRPENLTLVVMLPEGQALPQADQFKRLLTVPPAQPQPAPAGPAALTRPLPAAGAGQNGGPVQTLELPGGAKLLVQEDHSLPLFAVRAALLGGTRLEPAEQAGIFKLLASCWTRGAAGLSAEELGRRVEDLAGRLTADSGRNTFGLAGEFLSQNLDEGLDLFAKVLLAPSFDPAEVAKRKTDQAAALKAKEERPEAVAFRLFAERVYLNHPYGRDPLGTEESIKGLEAAQLKALHAKLVRAENLVLAVVGDVSAEAVQAKLAKLLAPLARGLELEPPAPPAALPQGGLQAEAVKPGQNQVHTILGFRGAAMTQPASYALDLLAEALANQSGRLFIDLRDKKSLAYALTASNSSGLDAGSFAFYVASAPEKEDQVRAELTEQLRLILAEPLSPAEFNGARARLLAQWIIDRQTMSSRAADLALYDRLGLGADYPRRYTDRLKELTPEAVLKAAQGRLDPGRPVWIRVGPGK